MTKLISLLFLLGLLSCTSIKVQGQEISDEVLSYTEFLNLVRLNHPIAGQGELLIATGLAEMLEAKGGLDPKISGDFSQKKFKGDDYYNLFNANVEVPTKFGMKIVGGYDRTSGLNLNPENIDPDAGLVYAGVAIPLGQGLLFDSRRAQLDQAALAQELSEIERTQLINELLFEASMSYWKWWSDYEELQIYQEAIMFAEEQYEGVVAAALGGDRAPIDTIEARIQLQQLELQRGQAQLNYLTSTLYISTYVWDDQDQPLLLNPDIAPAEPTSIQEMNALDIELSDRLVNLDQHPLIQAYDIKLGELDIQDRLAREYLKPSVNLKYNVLVEGGKSITNTLSTNNYNVGVDVKFPLFFRKEKAKRQKIQIYQEEIRLKRSLKSLELYNKLFASITKWQNFKQQYLDYTNIVGDYQRLLDGEQALFDNGESSLFLINSRQSKFLQAKIKLIGLYGKIRNAEIESYVTAGTIQL